MTQHIELSYGLYPVHLTFDVVHRPSTRSGSFQFDSLPSWHIPSNTPHHLSTLIRIKNNLRDEADVEC